MVRKLGKAESEVQGRKEKRKLRNLARLKKRKELQSAAKKVEKFAQSLAVEDDKPKKKKNKGKKKKFLKLEAFYHYHAGYRDQAKKWPLNPVNVIIQQLRSKTGLVIADMGCGDAKIAECLGTRNTVHSFDLVAKKPCVVACEMSNVPLENNSCDVVVFCLSLMGTNINEYLSEAHRLLKMGGELRIAEVTSRFKNVRAFMRGVCRMGFEFKTSKTMQDYFVVFQFKKAGKIEHKRPNGLTLKPCLYKKR
ncbi:hypothetical protein QR680_007839 [Steinernema hermaphroditum]|uniref:Ribosomal RNA-processing protein 8 n=1 Tax=Steinernema hermaphroditum TaxID=289476 RepID=A0AA39IEE0_9BILA|nr:hypothetical protein QR680_007839 [Steinernema hermaphroditum]